MDTSLTKLNKAKTTMVLYQLEESLGEFILTEGFESNTLPEKTVEGIIKRNDTSLKQTSSVEDFIEASYLEELFHFALEATKDTSKHKYIIELIETFKALDIFSIRNAIAHPNKPFLDEYWYKVAMIASSNLIKVIGLNHVLEKLISVENGIIGEPPDEWLEEITHTVVKNNLPTKFDHSITGLIGRKDKEKEIIKLLNNPRIATLGIVASGGIGKTAIVLDILNKLILDTQTLSWCDGIIFVDMKLEKLTAKGIESLKAIETIEEVKKGIINEINRIFHDNLASIGEVFKKYEEKKLLIFIDNLETLLRDGEKEFEKFNLSLPKEWRLLVTSRIPISSASIVGLEPLGKKSAIQLAKKYTVKTGSKILEDSDYDKIIEMCYKNPLAIRLTIDLYNTGERLPESINKSSKLIAEFSFQNLIDKISENSIMILEALYIDPSINRVRLCELLNLSLDDIVSCINELSKTSLISRKTIDDSEVFDLTSSVRELVLSSPRNIKVRNRIQEQLKQAKIVTNEITRIQDIYNINELDMRYIPQDTNDNLKILVNDVNHSYNGNKINHKDARSLFYKIDKVSDVYKDDFIYHRTRGRLLLSIGEVDSSISSYKNALELNEKDCATRVALAHVYLREKVDYKEAEKIFEDIIERKKFLEYGRMAKTVLSGYLTALLYQGDYLKIIEKTVNWRNAKGTTMSILGVFYARAWRKKLENLTNGFDKEYLEALNNAVVTIDKVFKDIGYLPSAIGASIKIFDDVKTVAKSINSESKIIVNWLNIIDKHLITIVNESTRLEEGYIYTLVIELSQVKIQGNPFLEEKWDTFRVRKFANSVSEDDALQDGFIVARISNIPKVENFSHSSFIFVSDDEELSYLVHKESFKELSWEDWKLLDIGMTLGIRPINDINGKRKSSESCIIESI